LDRLEGIVDPRYPGDRGSLASGWVSVVLTLAFFELGVLAEENH
jgi:hypothetical protein